MKSIQKGVLVLCTVGMLLFAQAFTNEAYAAGTYSGGDGSSSNPFKISTPQNLAELALEVNSGTHTDSGASYAINPAYNGIFFALTNTIDMSGYPLWAPIGSQGNRFSGVFDGQGYTITGLSNIASSADGTAGLFGRVGQYGVIKNTKMINGSIIGDGSTEYLGAFVGVNDGLVFNCSNACSVAESTFENSVAGIVGWNFGSIEGCTNAGAVTDIGSFTALSNNRAGGIAGTNEGRILDCSNTGTITCDEIAGGIAGMTDTSAAKAWAVDPGLIQNCYNTGSVNGVSTTYSIVGGIVGISESLSPNGHGEINSCFNSGDITALEATTDDAGGLAGSLATGSVIVNSYNTGRVASLGYTGGLIGQLVGLGTTVSFSYNTGEISGTLGSKGALVGTCRGGGVLTDCYYNSLTSKTASAIGVNIDRQSATALTTSQMIASNVLTDSMPSLATSDWQKRPADNTFCYYPELKVFANATTMDATAVVARMLPTIITAPSATSIMDNALLSTSVLSGGAVEVVDYASLIPGVFSWANGNITLNAGTQSAAIVFTPDDELFLPVSGTTTLLVTPAPTPDPDPTPDPSPTPDPVSPAETKITALAATGDTLPAGLAIVVVLIILSAAVSILAYRRNLLIRP